MEKIIDSFVELWNESDMLMKLVLGFFIIVFGVGIMTILGCIAWKASKMPPTDPRYDLMSRRVAYHMSR